MTDTDLARGTIGRRSGGLLGDVNLPNLITLGRLLAVPFAVWMILDNRYAAAFWVFVGAGASDALDGYIAKHFDRQTRLGAILDPTADKALLTSVYVTLGLVWQLPDWLVALVLARDVLITVGFFVIRSRAGPSARRPLFISKVNTLVQIALVAFVLAQGIGLQSDPVKRGLIYIAAATTVLSGFAYLVRLRRVLTRSGSAS